jgi:hypothetical protein
MCARAARSSDKVVPIHGACSHPLCHRVAGAHVAPDVEEQRWDLRRRDDLCQAKSSSSSRNTPTKSHLTLPPHSQRRGPNGSTRTRHMRSDADLAAASHDLRQRLCPPRRPRLDARSGARCAGQHGRRELFGASTAAHDGGACPIQASGRLSSSDLERTGLKRFRAYWAMDGAARGRPINLCRCVREVRTRDAAGRRHPQGDRPAPGPRARSLRELDR